MQPQLGGSTLQLIRTPILQVAYSPALRGISPTRRKTELTTALVGGEGIYPALRGVYQR